MKTCISPIAMRPVLYTDTINGGHQAMRDDLWAVTTDELNDLHNAVQQAATVNRILQDKINRLEAQQNEFRPDFLLNGTRFKLNFSPRGNVDVFHNYARELQGLWVALVPAEDDCHLAQPAASLPATSSEAAPVDRDAVLEEAALLVELKDDGIWANTCGHSIRALKTSAATAGGAKL